MNSDTLRKSFTKSVLSDKDHRHWVLERLYELQTPNEQARWTTKDRNGVGFTAPDAPILSSLADKLASGEALTVAEETVLKWRLPKYWRQFTETRIMNPPDRKPSFRAISRASKKAKTEAA